MLKIAHRGASSEAPENTLASLRQAIDIGVDYVEIDVYLAGDGVPVVIHDETTARTANGIDCDVQSTPSEELCRIDVGAFFAAKYAGEGIPTLQAALNLKVPLMVEIKKSQRSATEVAKTILQLMASRADCLVGSFEVDILEAVQRQAPSQRVIGIAEELEYVDKFLSMGIKHLALWHPLISGQLMALLKEHAVEVWVFTVDQPNERQRVAALGVDGIITNDPRSLK